jgi:RND family efflux transporter MFP subunit
MKKSLILPFAVFATALACSSEKPASDNTVQPVPVAIVEVKPEKTVLPLAVTGVVKPSQESRLGFKTGGRIAYLPIEAGQPVRKGDVLAELDLTEIRAMYDQSSAALEKAKRDVARVENLFRDSTATLEQLQNAKTGLEVATKQHDVAAFALRHSQIIAETDGVVLKRLANTGEWTAPGVPVVWLQQAGEKQWKVSAGIADHDWATISVGDSVSVTGEVYPDAVFRGRVSDRASMADPATGLFTIDIALAPSSYQLASGLTVRAVVFPSQKRNAMRLPASSIVSADGKRVSFFALDSNGATARQLQAETIGLTGADVLIKTLPQPVHVITTGARYIRNGSPVTVLQSGLLASNNR